MGAIPENGQVFLHANELSLLSRAFGELLGRNQATIEECGGCSEEMNGELILKSYTFKLQGETETVRLCPACSPKEV